MSELTVLADYGDLCGEGPIWDATAAALYWTDCGGFKFYRYDWAARQSSLVKDGFEVNGAALAEGGGFTVSNNSGLWQWDGMGDARLIAGEVGGIKCQMNDCVADAHGRLLAGTWFYNPAGDYPLGHLMCVDTDGSVTVLDEGIHLANGLGFSPDNRTLYFSDSAARRIYAYDYDLASGSAGNRRVFVQVPATQGLPDGLTVDADGYVWSAQWYGSCVIRYDPDGKVERRIATPAKQTSSVAFGGPDYTDIFITSAGHSEPMPIMPPGYNAEHGYFGGRLYHINLGIQGKPEPTTRIAFP